MPHADCQTPGKGEKSADNFAIGSGLVSAVVGSGIATKNGVLNDTPLGKSKVNIPQGNNEVSAERLTAIQYDKWDRKALSIQDQMTLEAAQTGAGKNIISNLNDPKFKGWDKYEYKEKSNDGLDSVVHYVKVPNTDYTTDFKFKKQAANSVKNEDKQKSLPKPKKFQ